MQDILDKDVETKYTLSDKLWIYLQNYAAKQDTQAYQQFGNSVVVPLIENAAKLIVEQLEYMDARTADKMRKVLMATEYSNQAIQEVLNDQRGFCKFLSANDTGATGGPQAGIYIPKSSTEILFSELGQKGENKDKWVKVKWQDDFVTDTRFIYYGRRTRNEYRIINFGRDFPFLTTEYTGALFVFVKADEENYLGYVLNSDDDIEIFLNAFGLSPTETKVWNIILQQYLMEMNLNTQLRR